MSPMPTSDIEEYLIKINLLFADLFSNEKAYNSWESGFIQNMKESAEKYKLSLLLSQKQRNKIDDLIVDHELEENDDKTTDLFDDPNAAPF